MFLHFFHGFFNFLPFFFSLFFTFFHFSAFSSLFSGFFTFLYFLHFSALFFHVSSLFFMFFHFSALFNIVEKSGEKWLQKHDFFPCAICVCTRHLRWHVDRNLCFVVTFLHFSSFFFTLEASWPVLKWCDMENVVICFKKTIHKFSPPSLSKHSLGHVNIVTPHEHV